jgi:glycosyltransferase involved in cell wall biosynthesis
LDWGALEGWGRATFDALSDLHAEAPLDVVWAIHGDDGAHEAAHRFHRATGVPWVADFKDPWHIFHKVAAVPLQFVATAHRLRSAAMLTETCERQGTFDVIFRRPTETIWSGYDAELMDTAPPVRSAPELSLVYVGHFATGRHDAAHLGRVLGEWDARDRDRKWALHVYGGNYGFLEASFASSRAARRLRLHPYTTQERAYGLMKGADVLVLLPAWNGWRGGGSVGVKELEYMASGTPLLCLGHLMDEMKPVAARCGTVFDSGDVDEAAIAFLQRQYDAFTSGNASPRVVNAPAVRAYAWPEQAKRLAAVLERAVDGSKR